VSLWALDSPYNIFSSQMATNASRVPQPPRDPLTAKVEPVMTRFEAFWQRVTEGMKVDQLWKQFQADARASYRLYSREVDLTHTAGIPKWKHYLRLALQFFWAIMEKLSPARRVLLLIALMLMFAPTGQGSWEGDGGQTRILFFDSHC